MTEPRNLLTAAVAGAFMVTAAVPALAQTGTVRTADGSGHAIYSVKERKDPDGDPEVALHQGVRRQEGRGRDRGQRLRVR